MSAMDPLPEWDLKLYAVSGRIKFTSVPIVAEQSSAWGIMTGPCWRSAQLSRGEHRALHLQRQTLKDKMHVRWMRQVQYDCESRSMSRAPARQHLWPVALQASFRPDL